MTLRDVLTSLENIKNDARDCEEDMWHEENAILEGVFRDIADEAESIIDEIESILDLDISQFSYEINDVKSGEI